MPSLVDRQEYIEAETGLIWRGGYDNNAAMVWHFDQFHFPNLEISMHLLRRLDYEYRNDLSLVSRQISYAVGNEFCYGKWSEPYTTGSASGGYSCGGWGGYECKEPWSWTGTTEMMDYYRDVLNKQYAVQYCQCWVFSGVSTTVGRALGIPSRSVTNFQSAHDTDYNRGIDNYVERRSDGYLYLVDGQSADSVWNFHVWNDMYFSRNDYTDSQLNGIPDWNAVDATPQEASYGGNPFLGSSAAYQMGPAQLSLVKNNDNTAECLFSLGSGFERFGCFDQEFVISEVNAQYNVWMREGTFGPFDFYDGFMEDPWDAAMTIGQQMSVKKPGVGISDDCVNQWINDCSNERLDVTMEYKYSEPSGPGMPTDPEHYHDDGRRRLLDENENGIETRLITFPNSVYLQRTIVAERGDDLLRIYGDDYSFAEMSLEIASFFDENITVLCSLTVTAHDYTGLMIGNESVLREQMRLDVIGGDVDECMFNVTYEEYESVLERNKRNDVYALKLTLLASVYVGGDIVGFPFENIMREADFKLCVPRYVFIIFFGICSSVHRQCNPVFYFGQRQAFSMEKIILFYSTSALTSVILFFSKTE